jgi:hypothetical protein
MDSLRATADGGAEPADDPGFSINLRLVVKNLVASRGRGILVPERNRFVNARP